MKHIVLIMGFIVLSLSGCRGSTYQPDCAADGPNCKQLNPGLDKHPVPPMNPELDKRFPAPPGCAADGPGCKQFNPNKP